MSKEPLNFDDGDKIRLRLYECGPMNMSFPMTFVHS